MKRNSSFRTVLKIAVVILLLISLLIYIEISFDLGEIFRSAVKVGILFTFLSLLCGVAQFITEGLSYYYTLRSFGCKVSFFRSVIYAAVDLFYMNISPCAIGGLPALAVYMTKDGIDISHTGLTIILFTSINKFSMFVSVVLSLGAVPLFYGIDNPFFGVPLVFGTVVMLGIIVFCSALVLSPSFAKKLVVFCVKFFAKVRIVRNFDKALEKAEAKFDNYYACSSYIKTHPFSAFFIFLMCVIKRITMLLPAYFAYCGFGLETSSFAYIIGVQAILGMALESFIVPGSVGAYEIAAIDFYTEIFGDLAIPAVLYFRAVTYIFTTLASGALVAYKHIRVSKE